MEYRWREGGERAVEIDNKRSLTTGFNAATAKINPNRDKRMAIFRNLWINMDVANLKNKFIILRF